MSNQILAQQDTWAAFLARLTSDELCTLDALIYAARNEVAK